MRGRSTSPGVTGPLLEALEPRLLLSVASPLDVLAPATAGAAPIGLIVTPAVEQESAGGASNDDFATAEALAFSYLVPHVSALDGVGPQQAAVTGTADAAAGEGYDYSKTTFTPLYGGSSPVSMLFTGLTPPGGGGLLIVTAGADLGAADKYLTLEADGAFLAHLFVNDGLSDGKSSTEFTLTQDQLADLAADGTVSFVFTASTAMKPSGSSYVQVQLVYPGSAGGDADCYSFELGARESASLALAGSADLSLGVYDAAGELLATAETGDTSPTAAIEDLLPGAEGTYYVKVQGSGEYTLVVNRNATLDTPANDSFDSAQQISSAPAGGRQWVVGRIDGAQPDIDVYALTLGARGVLQVRIYAPAADGGLNELAPVLRLYDSSGELVAVSDDGRLQFHAPKGGQGEYFLEVAGADDADGEYVLSVKSPLKGGKGAKLTQLAPGGPGQPAHSATPGAHPAQAHAPKSSNAGPKG